MTNVLKYKLIEMKTINPSELSPMQVQMILQTAVAPRPIALLLP